MALKKINRFLGRYAKGMQFFTSSPYITRISSKMAQVPPGWSKYVFLSFFFNVAEVLLWLHSHKTLISRALIRPKSNIVSLLKPIFLQSRFFSISCFLVWVANYSKASKVLTHCDNDNCKMNTFSKKLSLLFFQRVWRFWKGHRNLK